MSEAPPTHKAAVLVKQAQTAYNASDFDQVIAHSRAALNDLDHTPTKPEQNLLDQAYEQLCLAYQRLGDFASARDVVAEWELRTQRTEGLIRTLIHRSRIDDYLGNTNASTELADQAIQQAQAAGYALELGIAKRIRADMYWKRGRPERALALGQEAITLLEQNNALDPLAGAHVTMAAAYHAGGQFYKAIEHLQHTARIVAQLGRRYELSIVYSNMGETYAELYAMDRALEAHRKALELVGIDRASPDLIRNLGVDLLATGSTDEGMNYLLIALERAQQNNEPDMIAQVRYSLAKYELQAGNLDRADTHSAVLHELAEHLDSLRHRVRALMIRGEIARQRGDILTAQVLFSDCSMLAQESADLNTIWRTHAALYELMRTTMPQMAHIHRRMAADMMTDILASIEDDELRRTFRNAEPVKAVLDGID